MSLDKQLFSETKDDIKSRKKQKRPMMHTTLRDQEVDPFQAPPSFAIFSSTRERLELMKAHRLFNSKVARESLVFDRYSRAAFGVER